MRCIYRRSVHCRKVLKQIGVADLLPDETVDAVREARLLAKVCVGPRRGGGGRVGGLF